MNHHGIDIQVLPPTVPSTQTRLGLTEAVQTARPANDHLADVAERHPTRFTGMAALFTLEPAAAATELRRATIELGLREALVNDHTSRRYVDEAAHEPLSSAPEELDVVL